jgi:hypothetical protein
VSATHHFLKTPRKRFFFEKKNQKTSAPAGLGDSVAKTPPPHTTSNSL